MFSRHGIVPMRALQAVSAGELTPVDICVLAALGAHIAAASESLEDWVWPSLEHLAGLIGKSAPTVFRSIQRLEEAGWIKRDVSFTGEGRGRKKTYYRVIFDAPVYAATARQKTRENGADSDGAPPDNDQLSSVKVGPAAEGLADENGTETGPKPGQDQLSKRGDQLSKTHDQLSKRGDQLSSHSMKCNRNRNSKTRARHAPARGRHRSGQPPDGASGSVSGNEPRPVGLHGDLVRLAERCVSGALADKWLVCGVAYVEVAGDAVRVFCRSGVAMDRLAGAEFQTLWPLAVRQAGVKRLELVSGSETYQATGPPHAA